MKKAVCIAPIAGIQNVDNNFMAKAVAEIDKAHYSTKIVASSHEFVADEPIDEGGGNLGPQPTELFAASLASCTAITLRMYADRKEWDVDQIKVNVAVLNENNETQIIRNVSISGNLDDAQRERMLVIANKCPVHKILTQPIKIETTLNLK